MKRLFLTLILAITVCGSSFAQFTSNWPNFNGNYYQFQQPLVAAIMINGEVITADYDGWDALEVAFFANGECRGAGAMFQGAEESYLNYYLYNGYVEEYGDPFPILDGPAVYYENAGETVSVQMYDHLNGILYENCQIILEDELITVRTGEEHMEGYWNPEQPIFLNFVTGQSFTKDIIGVGENNWNETNNGGYYLIASPLAGETNPADVENMINEAYDLYAFDQAQDLEWINYQDENDGGFNLVSGKGYLYASKEDVTLTFTGTPYDGNGEVTLVKDENANLSGWNLVGNPFTVEAYITKPYYTLNTYGSEVMSETSTAAIAPMEGVFVIADQDGETLTFNTDAPAKSGNLALNLTQGHGVIDRAVVNFGKGTLPKFQLNPNSTKVYIPVEGEDFAVVSAGATGEMPVNFKAAKNGNYTLSFTSQEVTFTYLHLIDNMTGNDVNLLSTPSYNFDARTTDYASRFRLVFATGSSIDGDSFGFVNGMGNLCIFGIEGEATLQVVDVLGHVISSNQFSGSYESKLNVAPGTYMLRLIQGDNVMVQKMVIK